MENILVIMAITSTEFTLISGLMIFPETGPGAPTMLNSCPEIRCQTECQVIPNHEIPAWIQTIKETHTTYIVAQKQDDQTSTTLWM